MLIAAQRYTFLAIKTNIRAKQIKKNGRQIKKAMKIQTTRIYRETEEAVVAAGTVGERMMRSLREKKSVQSALLDNISYLCKRNGI